MPSQSFHDVPLASLPGWDKGNFNRPGGSYGLRKDYADSVVSTLTADETDLQSDYCESIYSDRSSVTAYTDLTSLSVKSAKRPPRSVGRLSLSRSVKSILSSNHSSRNTALTGNDSKRRLWWGCLIPANFSRIMSLLIAAGVAAFAGFMYNVPIMQKVEMKSLGESLNRNVYCQQHATDELMRHVREYTALGQKGPVLLFLTGPEGCGKTHTINTMIEINPSWTKIVASHEQAYLNQLGEEDFISSVRKRIHSSTLNFIFVDDVRSLQEGTPFVEMKLKPLLANLKFENTPIFVVITISSKDIGTSSAPEFLTREWEYQVIPYAGLNRSCVERCALDVILALDRDPRKVDLEGLMKRFDLEDNDQGQKVSVDGCKSVPIKVAIYLEGDPPVYDDAEGDRTL